MKYIDSKNNETHKNMRELLHIFFKHKRLILIVYSVILIIVAAITFLLSPLYEAKSTLLVKLGREYVYRPEIGNKTPAIIVNQEEVINSEMNILKSQDLIEKVINTLKIENIYPDLATAQFSNITPLEAAVLAFKKKLSVEALKRSNVIEVSFMHKNKQIAAQAVNMLVDFYKEKHLQIYSGEDSAFLDRQLVAYDRKLKASENNMKVFKEQHNLSALDEERSLLLTQRTELDSLLKNTRSSSHEVQKRLASLKKQMQTMAASKDRYTQTEREKIIVDAQGKLLSLQLEEQELLKKYGDLSRPVQDMRKEIKVVTNFLQEQEKEISGRVKMGNPVYQEIEKEAIKAEADLHSQRAKENILQKQLAQTANAIKSLDVNEGSFQDLKRDIATNEKNYGAYAEKAEDARIADNMNLQKLANVSVIQKAIPPAKPLKPKKTLNMLLAIVLGAATATGLAFIIEFAGNTFNMPESVEKHLELPVLAAIQLKINPKSERR